MALRIISKRPLYHDPGRMHRPARTVAILTWQRIAQPAIRQTILTPAHMTRRVVPQPFHLSQQIIGPFNLDLMQEFALETELHAPHIRDAIPSIPLPQVIEPGLTRLLFNFYGLVVDAA